MDTIETERTPRRDRRRGRGRRRAAATMAAAAAVVGAVGTVQAVTAEPAAASYGCGGLFGWFWDTTGDCYYDEFIWAVVGGTYFVPQEDIFVPVATPTVALSKEAGDALDNADVALDDPVCNELITRGPITRTVHATADDVLMSRKTTAGTIAEMPKTGGPNKSPATTNGVGTLSRTTLYREFYDPVYNASDYERVPVDGPLSPEELQVLIILHETAHATGALPRETDGMPPRDFNSRIIEDCLGLATVTPAQSAPPPPEEPPPAPPTPPRCTRPPCPYTQPDF